MQELSAAARAHFTQPRYAGQWPAEMANVATARVELPNSGEILQLQLCIDHGVIMDARFLAYGCGWLIACGSLLTECLIGRTLEEAGQFRHHALVEALMVPPEKLHCAVLAETALRTAIKT